jgi:beta-RFAP synthase
MSSNATLETAAGQKTVTVEAPSRLHMGFVDLNGNLGRKFGSLGLALDGVSTEVRAKKAPRLEVTGPGAERVEQVAEALAAYVGAAPEASLEVVKTIPAHVGLGSGTQMALAAGMALNRLFGWGLTVQEISEVTERGARSGMGVGAFCEGGFFLDGGKGAREAPPPILSRVPFPNSWRLLLVFDETGQGLHGKAEKEAFAALPTFPEGDAEHLARLVMMRILPALVEWDIDGFSRGLGELQASLGDYFAPAQGGRFTSPRVAEVMEWLKAQGIHGVGQSSWGPTGFAVFGDARQAFGFQRAIRERFEDRPGLRTEVVAAAQTGARISELSSSGAESHSVTL